MGVISLTSCASVDMVSNSQDVQSKKFENPPLDKAGLYIYRNSLIAPIVKIKISLDGVIIGETANKVYFYKEISLGHHKLSTESEFSDNSLEFNARGGKNYFARQDIKIGVLSAAVDIIMVIEKEGKKQVRQCKQVKINNKLNTN